eukprot:m.141479 g.141479  ORF g.141479 m.141479 type:complete len:211 (-) comp13195_c0_seq8:3381-4013(-)
MSLCHCLDQISVSTSFILLQALLSSRLFFPYKTELDGEDLYTPQDSIAFQQRIFVEETFGFDDVANLFFLDGGSLLSTQNTNTENQQALLSLLAVYETMLTVNVVVGDETVTYASRCNTTATGCQQASVLNFFEFNATTILNDNNVMNTINTALAITQAQGLPQFSKHVLFGDIIPNDNSTTVCLCVLFSYSTLFFFLFVYSSSPSSSTL